MARRRRLTGKPRYSHLDWYTNSQMWRFVDLNPIPGVTSALWTFGPTADEEYMTVKRIRGQIFFRAFNATNASAYELDWWVVPTIIDGTGAIVARMDDPTDSALAEDNYLDYRHIQGRLEAGAVVNYVPQDDFSHPWWTNVDIKAQRRLKYPQRLTMFVWGIGWTDGDLTLGSRCRALIART